jgi:IS30 family transposase
MKRTHSHLSDEERRKLEQWRHAKISPDVIAEKLGWHRSAVFRELKRNRFRDEAMPRVAGYYWMVTKAKAAVRRAKERKLIRHPNLREQIIDRIRAGWTPEQIAGRLRLEGVRPRVCQETIHRSMHSKEGMEKSLWWHLPERRVPAPPTPCPEAPGTEVPAGEQHRVPSRRRRAPASVRPLGGRPDPVPAAVRAAQPNLAGRGLQPLRGPSAQRGPQDDTDHGQAGRGAERPALQARRSITFNRGSEFVDWPHLQARVGVETWLGRPALALAEGHRRERQPAHPRWLPRDTDPATISSAELKEISSRLNATPRRCLGWRTPAEAFRDRVLNHHA